MADSRPVEPPSGATTEADVADRNDARLLTDEGSVRGFLVAHYGEAGARARFEFVSGGVSSSIIRVESDGTCFILKQALPQLRVSAAWHSRPERSGVEARCARALDGLVPGSVPRVLREFPDHHAFSMACAPDGSAPWKALLLQRTIRASDAIRAGALLGDIHSRSAGEARLAEQFADTSYFDELRLDPYLRFTAARHPDVAPVLDELVAEALRPGICLVHADFSPKNLLITPRGQMLVIDHEVAHWGNPAFDLAFLVNHLCLKALRFEDGASAYLRAADGIIEAYREHAGQPIAAIAAGPRGGLMLGGLLLARIDGKSPVEYIDQDGHRELVRQVARRILVGGPSDIEAALAMVKAAT